MKTVANSPEINDRLVLQIMEDLNLYAEIYILTAEFNLLRSKIRLLHQSLPKGELKSSVRGLLTFLKRWPKKKIWLRISSIMGKFMKNKGVKTLYKRRVIENNRYVGHANILAALNGPEILSIKRE